MNANTQRELDAANATIYWYATFAEALGMTVEHGENWHEHPTMLVTKGKHKLSIIPQRVCGCDYFFPGVWESWDYRSKLSDTSQDEASICRRIAALSRKRG